MTDLEPRIGMMLSEFAHPNMIRIGARIGYRFLIVDAEHGAFDLAQISALAAASAGQPVDLLVRIPVISKEYVGPLLDAGVDGLVAPMVNTPELAAELVRLGAYPPVGERGVSLTRAHSGYHVADATAYMAEANRRVKLYAQIETRAAVAAVQEIAAIPGLGGLIVGPNDLLQSIGAPGDYANAELREAIALTAAAAAKAGIESGIITPKVPLLVAGAADGMTLLSMDSDVGNLIRGGLDAVATLEGALKA